MKIRFPLTLIILGYFLLEVIFPKGILPISLGNINVYVLDLITLLCIFGIFLKLYSTNFKLNKNVIPLLFLGFLLLTSLLRGVLFIGVETAFNYGRVYLYFFVIALSVFVLDWNEISISKLLFFWGIVSWLVFAIVLFRWMQILMGFTQNVSWVFSEGKIMRVINASQTLFLVQAVIMAFFIPKDEKLIPFQKVLPWVFIPTIILLQHRTIWVILMVVLLFFALKKIKTMAIIIPLLILGLILIFLVFPVDFENNLVGSSLINSVTDMRTFVWRLESWKQLISPNRYQSFVDYVIGQPFGTGYSRISMSDESNLVSPHNFLIQTILNIGFIGLFLLLFIYFKSIGSLFKHNRRLLFLPFFLLLFSQLLFFLAYAPNFEQGLLLGSAIRLLTIQSKPHTQMNDKSETKGHEQIFTVMTSEERLY